MKDFDILKTPLHGTHLIEANAGTGKTYALSGLYLRLILERELSAPEILVVTYTRAATQELRDRIRTMLRDGMEWLSGDPSEDPFLTRLLEGRERDRSLHALGRALQDFDETAIFTIHGFCQRLLQENAFEAGSLLDVELLTQERVLDLEIVEDFWRNQMGRAEPEWIHYLFREGVSPEDLLMLLEPVLRHPGMRVVPEIEIADLAALAPYRQSLHALRDLWPIARDEVMALLMDPGIKGQSYGITEGKSGMISPREVRIGALCTAMDQFLHTPFPVFPPFGDIEKLTAEKLADSMKKGCRPPEHQLFALCDRLVERKNALEEEMAEALLVMKRNLFRYAADERRRRKTKALERSYDDLLTDTLRALEDPGKRHFEEAARSRYQAALIDEFQDTDPIQYRIFQALFRSGKKCLFFIGDPKQAIYGFRGADVVTYLKAAESMSDRYTLRLNWRSEPDLVMAVNHLFSGMESPFVHREITYSPSKAAIGGDVVKLHVEGETIAPVTIWTIRPPEKEDGFAPLPKKTARPMILNAVAAEIVRLIQMGRSGKALIGSDPLSEKHMAVLVRTNREAGQIQETLGRLRVPSVLYNAGNLFETREAEEVERILRAVAESNNETHIRAALATDLMGVNGEALARLAEDEDAWGRRIGDFDEYHRVWEEQGFALMFRRLMTREKVRSRMLVHADGERRLTNLLHLGEVLHRVAFEDHLGMTALLKWLARRRQDRAPAAEEHLLRLESDEEAVKIVTVHKSKGLEYPVVFCPFLWNGRRSGMKEVVFHDPERDLALTLDLGSPEKAKHRALAEEELLAEDLRLLYVALTRAKNRCYVVWGRIKDAETSPLAYVIHARNSNPSDRAVKRAENAFQPLTRERFSQDLARLERDSGGTIRISPLPSGQAAVQEGITTPAGELRCKSFSTRISRDWGIASFSSLISRGAPGVDFPDHDSLFSDEESLEETSQEEETIPAIFAFPRGTRTGTCLHDILEHLDFRENGEQPARELITRKLDAYGFDLHWADAIDNMMQRVLGASLDPGDPSLRLEKIGTADRLNEVEFSFPLKTMTPDLLGEIFSAYGGPDLQGRVPEKLERLLFSPLKGFLKGFIDLVFRWNGRFYLVDWKSNYLGDRPADYGPAPLKEAMIKGHYHLQYHLYTLALDRYLGLRLPGYRYEKDFGGVFYIFLRGVGMEDGYDSGIFRDRPPETLISAMRKELIGEPMDDVGALWR